MPSNSKQRRVSYVIPPPHDQPPQLVLPPLDTSRNGRSCPIIIPYNAPVGESGSPAQNTSPEAGHHFNDSTPRNPQHRLGVTSLALDTSTIISGHQSPQGILYSGGRDGLIVAWEQSVPMRQRKSAYGTSEFDKGQAYTPSQWETKTGWSDGEEDSDEEDEELAPIAPDNAIPYENRWEPDYEHITEFKRSAFRQCVQSHTDWINDIVLCNYNRTLVSASNDGTLKAWNPHAAVTSDLAPTVIGNHMDYVRCVVHSRETQWVASGSFDRTIKLWDIKSPHAEPLVTLTPPESASSPKASIYALATDPAGHVIAAGSPERVIRLWDPRAGKRSAKLVGHSDNIRALLVSDDGKYVLSGSSDQSVKLWSLAAQRCLHTFGHHTDSVWSLFSNHPNLEIFYSGDRSGVVCKVDVEGCADISEGECIVVCKDIPDADEGKGSEGINKIAALDDLYVWTATGSSSIKRWTAPARRAVRARELDVDTVERDRPDSTNLLQHGLSSASASPILSRGSLAGTKRDSTGTSLHDMTTQAGRPDSPSMSNPKALPSWAAQQRGKSPLPSNTSFHSALTMQASPGSPNGASPESTLFGIPFQSLVRLVSLNDPYAPNISPVPHRRDADIATLYSAASIRSVPALFAASQTQVVPNQPYPNSLMSAFRSTQIDAVSSSPPSINNTRFALPPESVRDPAVDSAREAYDDREFAIDAVPLHNKPNDILRGSHGVVRSVILNDRLHALTVDTAGEVALWDLIRARCVGVFTSEDVGSASQTGSSGSDSNLERSPREALETVRERIEGEAMCPSWSTVDTKIGHLTVHMTEARCFDAEAYVDDTTFLDGSAYPEEHKLNIGKWIITNLFAGFVKRLAEVSEESQDRAGHTDPQDPSAPNHNKVPNRMSRGSAPTHINLDSSNRRRLRSVSDLTNAMRTPGNAALGTPALTPALFLDVPSPPPVLSTLPPGAAPPALHEKNGSGTPSGIPLAKASLAPHKDHVLSTIPQSPASAGLNVLPNAVPPATGTNGNTGKLSTTAPVANLDYFSAKGRTRSGSVTASATGDSDDLATPGPGGVKSDASSGFMGRLKNLGKGAKRPVGVDPSAAPILETIDNEVQVAVPVVEDSARVARLLALKALFAQPLALTPASEAPPLDMPPNTAIFISEEAADASGWANIYSGLVSTTSEDIEALEMIAPLWILELLVLNKSPVAPPQKVSFVVLPWGKKNDPIQDSSRLTAGRILRVRKILQYVKDKLVPIDFPAPTSPQDPARAITTNNEGKNAQPPATSVDPASAQDTNEPASVKAEEIYEIVCNDTILPIGMTIGAIKHYVWRQGGELTMYYRQKKPQS